MPAAAAEKAAKKVKEEVVEPMKTVAVSVAEKTTRGLMDVASAAGRGVEHLGAAMGDLAKQSFDSLIDWHRYQAKMVKKYGEAGWNQIKNNFGDKDFWKCFGGVIGDQAVGLAVTWAVGAAAGGPVGLGFAAAATGAAIGGAAGSCWGDHKQSAKECMATNGSVLVLGFGSAGASLGASGVRIAAMSRASNADELATSVSASRSAAGAFTGDMANAGLSARSLMGC